MQRNRSYRIAQRDRHYARTKSWVERIPAFYANETETDREQRVNRWSLHRMKNRASCSCYVCGNPRKWFKEKTLSEQRFAISCEEFLGEHYD